MALRFTVLASGSSGNASLIQADQFGLLLDFGLGPRELATRLAAIGASWNQVHAVLLTHTHSDHWNDRTLAYLRRMRIPLYCHPGHHGGLQTYGQQFVGLLADGLAHAYEAGKDLELTPGLTCRPLPVRHDGGPTFGFRLERSSGLFGHRVALGYAADLGSWSPLLAEALADVDVLALEFNHDVEMQYASGRSPVLIRRVLSDAGHLSNVQAAALVQAVLRLSQPGRLRHVVQLHLSQDCNRLKLAQEAARAVSGEHGFVVHTARQQRPIGTLAIGPGAVRKPTSARRQRNGKRSGAGSSQGCLPGFEP